MTCVNCHDPHQATVKTVAPNNGESALDDASSLCMNCHTEYTQNNSHSIHDQNDVSCVDCHLTVNEDLPAHTVHDHSFQATLSSCNACHADDIHKPAAEAEVSAEHPEVMLSSVAVASEPAPVSPLGFAGLAGLIGLAAGTVLAPWLEQKYHALNGKASNENE